MQAEVTCNDLAPEELFPHDQDHYGGLAANDALAERASIGKGNHVVDFCSVSRYFAHRYGADVIGKSTLLTQNRDRNSGDQDGSDA